MRLRIQALIWSIGVLSVGCQSQGVESRATVSSQAQAERAAREIYDQVELLPAAGSGAEEDEPADESDDVARQAQEAEQETSSPDGGREAIEELLRSADDSALCGNGELDQGELCDFGITDGVGECPDHCSPKPGCPDETLVVHGCGTRCMPDEEPSEECLEAE
jgi:hypothetical protein